MAGMLRVTAMSQIADRKAENFAIFSAAGLAHMQVNDEEFMT